MKRTAGGVVLIALALRSASVLRPYAQAQEPPCLHGADETPEQRTRRTSALQFTRHVNNLQAKAFPSNNAYQPAERLVMSQSLPSGFNLKMSGKASSAPMAAVREGYRRTTSSPPSHQPCPSSDSRQRTARGTAGPCSAGHSAGLCRADHDHPGPPSTDPFRVRRTRRCRQQSGGLSVGVGKAASLAVVLGADFHAQRRTSPRLP